MVFIFKKEGGWQKVDIEEMEVRSWEESVLIDKFALITRSHTFKFVTSDEFGLV